MFFLFKAIMLFNLLNSINENKLTDDVEFVPLKRIPYKAHVKSVMSFRCSVPQERAIDTLDFIGNEVSVSETVAPTQVPLHRCTPDSGVCFESGKTCCVRHEEPVQMVFWVEDKFTKKVRYVDVVVTNHTKCGCEGYSKIRN